MNDYKDDPLPDFDRDAGILDQLAAILDSRIVSGVVGVEGPPFAGKSTLARRLAAELGGSLISEHTDFDQHARELALSPWPEGSAAAAAERQAYFYKVERHRNVAASKALAHGSPVVMDRTALSVVVYSLSRAATIGDFQAIGARDLGMLLNDSGICFPEVLYSLEVPTAVLLERARRLEDAGTPRAIEPFLLCPPTLLLLSAFYGEISRRFRRCKVIVKCTSASPSALIPDNPLAQILQRRFPSD